MSLLGTDFAPFRSLGIPVGPLNQIQHVLHVCRHLVHRNTSLLSVPAVARILATHTGRQHRKRFAPYVLTELEKLIITQSFRLMVSPNVALRFPGFQRADCLFPIINVMQTVTVSKTTARETHELRFQIGQGLSQISPQAVLAPLKRLLREKRNHVQSHLTRSQRFHFDGSMVGIGIGFQYRSHFLPVRLGCFKGGPCHHPAILYEADPYLSAFAL